MTIKVSLPGGQWAEMRDVGDLTGADQDAYFDKLDELRARREIPALPERPDPANPAQMLPAEPAKPGTLTGADLRELRDAVLGAIITSWSLGRPLPFSTETRRSLPVLVCNALFDALVPMSSALQGEAEEAPKPGSTPTDPQDGTDGSSATSPGSTGSPLPAPPAVPSITPSA